MDGFSKVLSGDEVRNKYVLLPRGKENLFPKREDFDLTFEDKTYKAFIYPEESKAMGPKKKIFQYKLEFKDEVPDVFKYRTNMVFEQTDEKAWTLKLESK